MTSTEQTGKTSPLSSTLTASAIFGLLNSSFMVSYATLIYVKSSPEYFATAVALFLVGGAISSIILSMFSTYQGSVGTIQDVPVAVAGIIALSMTQIFSSQASPEVLFANIFMTIAVSTMLTGVGFLLLGYFKLGNLVRFIPFPVLGGFLAATGWLLVGGGIQVGTGVGFKISSLSTFVQSVPFIPLLLAISFGLILLILTSKFPKNMFVTPGMIIFSIAAFLVIGTQFGSSLSDLKATGWFLGPLPEGALWKSFALPSLSLVDWGIIIKFSGSIATIMVLSSISFLLNSSGIEIIAGNDLDMNKDLKASGIANLATGWLGAPASYVFVGETALATRIGAASRLVGVIQGGFMILVLIVGGAFLSFFPNFVAGGLLLFLGLSMLKEWLIDSLKTISKSDYMIILAIVLVVEFVGFLQGVAVGIIASVIIFVIRYSTISIIKNTLDGTQVRSSRDRPISEQRILDHRAEEIVALTLQGFIFFGTANSLYERVKFITGSANNKPGYFILDFALVQGFDSSAVQSFSKITLLLEKESIPLLLVGLSDSIKSTLNANGITPNSSELIKEFIDLDHATENCEDQIINQEQQKVKLARESGESLLDAVFSDMMAALEIQETFENLTDRLKPYMEEVNLTEGSSLYKQNEETEDIYFIISGRVSLSKITQDGKTKRIGTLGAWTVTGELGSYLGYRSPYDADVDKSGIAYKLGKEQRVLIQEKDPALANELQGLIIVMLGNEIMKTSKVIGAGIE